MKFILVLLAFTGVAEAARPDQAISWKESSCVCRDDKPVSKGDCVEVCRGKNSKGVDTLYAEFAVSSVLANSSLKNAKNWCYKFLMGDLAFPKCNLEATDSRGNKTILSNFSFPKDNALKVDVSTLPDDEDYSFQLVETTSKKTSLPHNIYIFDPVGIPLKTRELSQFACVPKMEKNLRTHFYYSSPWLPNALTGTESLVCHDVAKYGDNDSAEFPRLDLTNIALLWNQSNFLFFDNDGDGVLDINELVIKKVKENSGTIKSSVRLFGILSSPSSRELNREAGNSNYDHLGFVMSYFVDGTTFRSSCPTEADFATGKPLMKVMQEIFARGTEGIYVADRSENEVRDYILIRESDLRPVWFYLNNGVATKPTEENVTFQTVYFHYPVNKENPYVKGPNQKTYRVRSVQETGNLTTLQAFMTSTGEMISYPAHDRKIGCVPKL